MYLIACHPVQLLSRQTNPLAVRRVKDKDDGVCVGEVLCPACSQRSLAAHVPEQEAQVLEGKVLCVGAHSGRRGHCLAERHLIGQCGFAWKGAAEWAR